MGDLQNKIDDILNYLKVMDGKYETFMNELKQTQAKQSDLELKCNDMEAKNEFLHTKTTQLEKRVNDLEQAQLSGSFIIRGLPVAETNNSELKAIVANIIQQLKINGAEIIKLDRRPGKNYVKVTLANNSFNTSIIEACRKRRLTCNDLVFKGKVLGTKDDRIFIDEQLSNHNSRLFYQLRQLKKDKFIQFAWTKNGQVLARVDEQSKYIRITDDQDIKKLVSLVETVEMDESELKEPETNEVNLSRKMANSTPSAARTQTSMKTFIDGKKKVNATSDRSSSMKRGGSALELTANKKLGLSNNA